MVGDGGPSLTVELGEADDIAGAGTDSGRARPHRWSKEEAAEAARLSRESRAARRDRKPPSDDDIERGLRERAVSDPRAAEILLRWLQRPRADERVHGVDPDAMSEAQLEDLYAGLAKIAAFPRESCRSWFRVCSQTTKAPPERERSASRTTSSITAPRNCHTTATHLASRQRCAIALRPPPFHRRGSSLLVPRDRISGKGHPRAA